MGFKLVKLEKDKAETAERSAPAKSSIEEPRQGVTGKESLEATALAQAQEVAQHTRELLATRGWCLWKCSTLGGDIITVVLDENVEGIPGGYPVYTEAELEELCWADVNGAALHLVHEAKKIAGAKVVAINKS